MSIKIIEKLPVGESTVTSVIKITYTETLCFSRFTIQALKAEEVSCINAMQIQATPLAGSQGVADFYWLMMFALLSFALTIFFILPKLNFH